MTEKFDINSLNFPEYEEIINKIEKKVGKMPKRPKSLLDGQWTEQALKVLSERYLVKDENGNPIEKPEDMLWRVSWEIASAGALWGDDKKKVLENAKSHYAYRRLSRY